MWTKGKSGNPTGRPKGAAGLAKYAAEQTNNGQEMIDILIKIARGTADVAVSARDRAAAAQAVLDRCHGRPMQSTEITLAQQRELEEITVRPNALRPDTAFKIAAILRAERQALPAPRDVIDVASSDTTPDAVASDPPPASNDDHGTIVGITPEGATILAALSSSDHDPDPYDDEDEDSET